MATSRVFLICSPIGNLGDITYRAVETLQSADLIACEDTRHSLRLLQHYDITGKELTSLHDRNEQRRSLQLVERLERENLQLAILSDAGSPTISDPGYRLVSQCIEANIPIEVLPGPSAVITGLAGSGLPTDSFYFGGFVPVKSGRRTKTFEEAILRRHTSVYFESPFRIAKSVAAIADLDPQRKICIARELTKKFETFHRGTASDLSAEFPLERKVKGEITLIVSGSGRVKKSVRSEKD